MQQKPDFMYLVRQVEGINVEYAVDAMGGSEPLYEKTLRKAIRLIPANIAEMDKAVIEGGELKIFAIKVHGINGMLKQAGYGSLAAVSEALERAAKSGDRQFCAAGYVGYREELSDLYDKLEEIVNTCGENESHSHADGDIDSLKKALPEVIEAIESFDTEAAFEILSPFTSSNFGCNIDPLIQQATEALDMFKLAKASDYVSELADQIAD